MTENFKDYLEFTEYVNKHGAIHVPENWIRDISMSLPNLKLDIPTTQKKSVIDYVFDKKNPIAIQLADGSKLFFTLDEFRRLNKKPEQGKTMVVHFQRLPFDSTELPSQISHCEII